MKDLIIGAADNYTWKDIKVWVRSIKETSFDGDVVLIAYRVSQDLIDGCKQYGVDVLQINHDEFGQPINHGYGGLPTQSHKMRNLHIAQYLEENSNYATVAVTDTRDVYFQHNPAEIFRKQREREILIFLPSENILIENESWNANMIRSLFGLFIFDLVREKISINSGTVFGEADTVKRLMLQLYFMEKNFQHTGSDQPTLNVLTYALTPLFYEEDAIRSIHEWPWAAQCGTMLDPSKPHLLAKNIEVKPIIENGIVKTRNGDPFVVVHQYDRVPELKSLIEQRYI